MKKKITVRDFYKVLEDTVYEKNYGLLLNAIAHHEHTLAIKSMKSKDKLDKQFANENKEIGDKIFDYLYKRGFYDVE